MYGFCFVSLEIYGAKCEMLVVEKGHYIKLYMNLTAGLEEVRGPRTRMGQVPGLEQQQE